MKDLVCEVVTTLCKSSLSYQHEFSIEGLLGITVDNDDILLININKCVEKARGQAPADATACKIRPLAFVAKYRKIPIFCQNLKFNCSHVYT